MLEKWVFIISMEKYIIRKSVFIKCYYYSQREETLRTRREQGFVALETTLSSSAFFREPTLSFSVTKYTILS